jgi:hypothetical protein
MLASVDGRLNILTWHGANAMLLEDLAAMCASTIAALSKLGPVAFENWPCVALNGTRTPSSAGILRHDSHGFGDR